MATVAMRMCSLPRIRGGVSPALPAVGALAQSSPHTRGCFRSHKDEAYKYVVFPAYAGVFLS